LADPWGSADHKFENHCYRASPAPSTIRQIKRRELCWRRGRAYPSPAPSTIRQIEQREFRSGHDRASPACSAFWNGTWVELLRAFFFKHLFQLNVIFVVQNYNFLRW